MKVITKHITKQVISIFLLCQFIIVFLYLVIVFTRKTDDFIEGGALSLIFLYLLYEIPTMVINITPPATLISIIIVICQMKKNKEIMAMKACGINLHMAFQPIIIISVIISIFSFFLAERIVPYTSTKSNEIMEIEVKKRPQASFREWYKSETENNIYWIKHFDEETKTINDPVFYFFDDQFNLIKKVSGDACRWLGEEWEVENAKILDLKKDKPYSKQARYRLNIPETPDTFINKKRKSDNMSFLELKKRAEKQKAQGYDNTTDLLNLYMKLSYPFMSIVFAIIAIPLGLWEKIEGTPLSVTIGILTFFLFWVVMSSAHTLGLAGRLPPLLSAWTTNIMFTFSGIYLLMNIKK